MKYTDVIDALSKLANKKNSKLLARFFKTGKGQYGYGDVFIGVTVLKQRKIVKRFSTLPIAEIEKLLKLKIHEHRLTALLILVGQYKLGSKIIRKNIVNIYIKNLKHVNNWDLVDSSAHKILGEYLTNKPRDILYKLAKSKDLWKRRIAVISTFSFIQHYDFGDSLKIAEILLSDGHDLIHKAVGWMLREIGKKNEKILKLFLNKHTRNIPRTTLRYAIERFPENKRQKYLNKI